jgi:hypothetical protein
LNLIEIAKLDEPVVRHVPLKRLNALINGVVPNMAAAGVGENAVLFEDAVDHPSAAGRIKLAKHLMQVADKQRLDAGGQDSVFFAVA